MIVRTAAVLSLVVTLLGTMVVALITTHTIVIAYERNQGASQTSECSDDFVSVNSGCQYSDSQIQGDENAVLSAGQQIFPEAIDGELPPKLIDSDGDGVHDGRDNCPAVPNINQADNAQDVPVVRLFMV